MKCKLGDIAVITMGQSPKSEYYNSVGDGLPFLQGNRTFGKRYPIFDTYTTKPIKMAYAGDIIMSVRAPVGDLNFTKKDMCLGRGVCSIRMNNGCQDYLYYLLKFNIHNLLKKESGTVFGSVNRSDIADLDLDIADKSMQISIGRVLSMLDEKIELNDSINQNLEEQAKNIFHHMFVEDSAIKLSEGVLSDIATIIMGQSPSGSSYNETGCGEIFFQGRAEFGSRFPRIRLFTTEPSRKALKNDILMSVRAPVGDINIAHDNCCIGRGLSAIRSKDGHQSFVLYTMYTLRQELDIFNGEGTVFGSINRDSLNSLPIFIPPKDKIDKFESIVAPMDAAILQNYDEICNLEKIRDTLLPLLMSGELDVSELDI